MSNVRRIFAALTFLAILGSLPVNAFAGQVLTNLFDKTRSNTSDTLHLKNGEVLRGEVLNDAFNINTPYGFVRLPNHTLAGVSFGEALEAASGTAVTTNFNRLTGNITDWGIHFKPNGRKERTIAQNQIECILFRVAEEEDTSSLLDSVTNLFVMSNGDLLTGKPIVTACDIRVGNIDEDIPLTDIQSVEMRGQTNTEVSVIKRDGKVIDGTLNTKSVRVKLDLDIPLIEISCRDFTKLYMGDGAIQAAARFGIAPPTQYTTAASTSAGGGETITNSIGMTFNLVKPGSFVMGSAETEGGRDTDEAQHKVTLTKGYYLQVTEVTQKQWLSLMKENPSYFDNCEECPVERLMWAEIDQFIEKLNQMEPGRAYRLPTEAEWEYAARCGTSTAYWFGDNAALLEQHAWFADNSGSRSHPVAQKSPNPCGFYDMYGNAWEWCSDWKSFYPEKEVVDPKGPASGSFRVLRGGSWFDAADLCRSANRNDLPDMRKEDRGFRLVLMLSS